MNHLKRVEEEYLRLTGGLYDRCVPIEQFKFTKWEDFVSEETRFKVEFLTFPSWSGKFKYFNIYGDMFSHIKLKRSLM